MILLSLHAFDEGPILEENDGEKALFARMPAQLEFGRAAVDRADEAGTARAAEALLEEIGVTAARAEATGDAVHIGLGETRRWRGVGLPLRHGPGLVLEPERAGVVPVAEIVGEGRSGRRGQYEQSYENAFHICLPGKS